MNYIGTSGFGYHEWCPVFYPAGLCYDHYLTHYARHFRFCELNTTFFRMPSPAELERHSLRVGERFLFTVKLNRRLTHERGTVSTLAKRFADGLAPLVESHRLGAVLAQFPFSFVNTPHNRAYLCRLRAALELPLVVELRNPSWFQAETLGFLKGWGVGLAASDLPAAAGLPHPSAVATSDIGYVRFHGRNADCWWRRGDPRRYAYRYRQRELVSWLPRLRAIGRETKRVFVVFNNHRHGHAVTNALSMSKLLERSARRRKSKQAKICAG